MKLKEYSEQTRNGSAPAIPRVPRELRDEPEIAFISYSPENLSDAAFACETLENAKIRCWIAPRDLNPDADWALNLGIALNKIKIFVLIYSHDSVKSPSIANEIAAVLAAGTPILIFKIDDVETEKSLRRFSTILKSDNPAFARKMLTKSVEKLLAGEGVPVREKSKKSFAGTLKKVKFSFPKIRLPKITFPRIKFPKIAFPRIKLWWIFAVLGFAILLAAGTLFVAKFDELWGALEAKIEAAKIEKMKRAAAKKVENSAEIRGNEEIEVANATAGEVESASKKVPKRMEATSPDVASQNLPNTNFREATSGDVASMRVENPVPAESAEEPVPDDDEDDEVVPADESDSVPADSGDESESADDSEPEFENLVEFDLPNGEKILFSKIYSGEKWVADVAKTETSQGQWIAFAGRNPSFQKNDALPVENISWNDAMIFCEKLTEYLQNECGLDKNLRVTLPTSAQWEFFCRAGTRTKFHSGNRPSDLAVAAWFAKNSDKKTHRVGEKQPNDFDLYDMHGNVCEWCLDAPRGNARHRIYRGGSCGSTDKQCESSAILSAAPSMRSRFVGFRVIIVPAETENGGNAE